MNPFGFPSALLFLWALFSINVPLAGQTAEEFLETAYNSLDQGDWDAAIAASDTAASLFRKNSAYADWLKCRLVLANAVHDRSSDPFQALAITQSTLAEPWLKLQSEEDQYRYCKVLIMNAWLAKQLDDYTQVKEDMEKAYSLFKKHLPTKGPKVAGSIYAELGNAYVRFKEYEGARKVFEENFQYSKSYPECAKFNDYGSLYFSLGPDSLSRALSIFQQGLDFNQNQPADSKLPPAEVKLLLLNKAECLAQMGRYEEALAVNKSAAAYPLPSDDESYNRCLFGLYENYGIIYAGLGKSGKRENYPQSVKWYQKQLDVIANPQLQYPKREIALAQIALAEVLFDWGKHQEALKTFHAAMRRFLPAVGENPVSEPSISMLSAESMLLRALYGKARAFHALGQLEHALECFELIPIVEAKLRATHAYESSSLLALNESRQRFHMAVGIAWQLFEGSTGNPVFAERAFRLTELARGMLLLQSLVQARNYLPSEIREKDYELRVRMAWLEHEIAAMRETNHSTGATKIKDYENQLFDLKLERKNLLADYPSYNDPDSLFLEVLAAKDVHKLLRPDQAMADFFLTETDAYIFSFDAQGDFRWRKVSLPQAFREQTRDLVSYLWKGEDTGREQFLRQAWLLDSLMLNPERTRFGTAKSLVIVPDDVLMLVPFEILLSRPPNSGGSTWRDQPWLLAVYNFSYAYSATLLNIQKGISEEHEKTAQKPPHVFGGFAPSYSKSSAYKLQNTCSMVKNVNKMLGGHAWCDDSATEERFKNSAPDYRTLLLAMHGISDNEHPELSRLLFGDPGPDSLINNNILYASELQIMRLQADLVVLSACHSGSGRLEQGEGVYSLARAFAAAQVPATVMSLWLLHATTAQPLVEAFFKYLQEGKTKDEALRLAKLDFLKKDENFEMTHPFFWAGLAASGDMRALDLPAKPTSNVDWWWFVAIGAVGVVGVWWWRRRTKYKIPN